MFLYCFCILLLIISCKEGSDLGPHSTRDQCDSDVCPDPQQEEEEEEKGGEHDLKDRGETRPSIFRKLGYIFKKAGEAVVNTVYNFSAEALEDIAELIKAVFNEESYNLFLNAGQGVLNTIFDSDKLLTSVGTTVLSVAILIVCILLNYILASYISLLRLLAFDCTIILLHGIFGPVYIATGFISLCSLTWQTVKWMITYPYLFSVGIVSLFILSCLWPYIRRRIYCFRTTADIVYDIEYRLTRIEDNMEEREIQLDRIEDNMKKRLDRMESILMEIKEKVVTGVNATT